MPCATIVSVSNKVVETIKVFTFLEVNPVCFSALSSTLSLPLSLSLPPDRICKQAQQISELCLVFLRELPNPEETVFVFPGLQTGTRIKSLSVPVAPSLKKFHR